jgi:hypothetical protein
MEYEKQIFHETSSAYIERASSIQLRKLSDAIRKDNVLFYYTVTYCAVL